MQRSSDRGPGEQPAEADATSGPRTKVARVENQAARHRSEKEMTDVGGCGVPEQRRSVLWARRCGTTDNVTKLSWFDRTRLGKVVNYEDARRYARWVLPRGVFEYVDGGAEDEVTLRRNVEAFRDLRFRPRMGVWVPKPQLETTLFGTAISMPLLTAPCGGLKLIHPQADLGAARGAAAARTIHVASSASGVPLEEIAEVPGPKWFQLYRYHGRRGMENLVHRAQATGRYDAMVVTVDTTVGGKREKDFRNGFSYSMRVSVRNALRLGPQLAARPLWVLRYVRDGMPFEMANTAGMTRDGVPLLLSDMARAESPASPSWEDIGWIRANWTGPLLVKGLLTGEDARRAVDAGCEGVIVSNHGGRQLEAAPSAIDVLPEIAGAVGNTVEILLDGGIRRGGDVLKAVALGAKAVLIGRPYVWGLALGGDMGVQHVLELFRADMTRTMQLMGCESVDRLDPSWVADSTGRAREQRW